MLSPRCVSFSVQIMQLKDKDGNLVETARIGFGHQPADENGVLAGTAFPTTQIPDAQARIQQYATIFSPEVAQAAAADAAALEQIIKRWSAYERAAYGMNGSDLPQ